MSFNRILGLLLSTAITLAVIWILNQVPFTAGFVQMALRPKSA